MRYRVNTSTWITGFLRQAGQHVTLTAPQAHRLVCSGVLVADPVTLEIKQEPEVAKEEKPKRPRVRKRKKK